MGWITVIHDHDFEIFLTSLLRSQSNISFMSVRPLQASLVSLLLYSKLALMLRGNNKQHWYNRRLTLTVQVPKISGYWGSALTAAAQASALDFATLLLDIGVDVNAEGGEYHTALQAAVFAGDSSVVKLLLEHKADPYVVGGKFGTALLAASSASNTEALRLLLEAGATVNKIGGSYGSALIAAIEAGNLTCVEALLDHGANPDLPLHDNDAPVQIAARKDLLSILELLVDRGADLQVIDEDGRTITMLALSWNSHSIVEYLLKRDDIVLDKTDAAERTPLMIAVRQGSDFVGTLLKKGADPNARDWQGKTPLVQAVMMDFQEVVTTLLDHGADPTLADSRGRGPLYWACRRGSVEMFDSVLSALKIWKECSTRCERALHAAVAASRSDFISKLLEIKHTRPNEPGEDNWTPIYTAQRYARGSIVGQLSAAGGIDTDLVDVVGRRKWPSKWHPSDRSSSLRLSDDLMTVTTGGNQPHGGVVHSSPLFCSHPFAPERLECHDLRLTGIPGPPNPDNMPEPCGVILADYPMPGEGIFYFEVKIDNAPKSR